MEGLETTVTQFSRAWPLKALHSASLRELVPAHRQGETYHQERERSDKQFESDQSRLVVFTRDSHVSSYLQGRSRNTVHDALRFFPSATTTADLHMLVGSFPHLMARSNHRTRDVPKRAFCRTRRAPCTFQKQVKARPLEQFRSKCTDIETNIPSSSTSNSSVSQDRI
jgi:hypothetical protein